MTKNPEVTSAQSGQPIASGGKVQRRDFIRTAFTLGASVTACVLTGPMKVAEAGAQEAAQLQQGLGGQRKMTTMALGEEGSASRVLPGQPRLGKGAVGTPGYQYGVNPTTLAIGEGGRPKSLRAGGEEWGSRQPTTLMYGEEGTSIPAPTRTHGEGTPKFTTYAVGEEGATATTAYYGEEGTKVTTKANGEEGGQVLPQPRPFPTTLRYGEETGGWQNQQVQPLKQQLRHQLQQEIKPLLQKFNGFRRW